MTSLNFQQLTSILLRLPRELRDLVYPHIVEETDPVDLNHARPHKITDPTRSNSIVASESLEAYYAHNTFIVTFSGYERLPPTQRWGPNITLVQSQIRTLVVECEEPTSPLHPTLVEQSIESHIWKELFSLPRLSNLEVRMQKRYDEELYWQPITPVLLYLQDQNPRFEFKFTISFDDLLETRWNCPTWPISDDTSQLMGYFDITDMFARPTEKQKAYVQERRPDKQMPKGRSIQRYLSDFDPQSRRELGHLFIARDPDLLSVLVWEYFEVWKTSEEKRRNLETEMGARRAN